MAGRAEATTIYGESLDELLRSGSFDVEEVGRRLDQLNPAARLTAVRSLGGRAQAELFDAAKGIRKLRLEDLVPFKVPAMQEVAHEGKNSLPAFTHFAKVFCRPKQGEARELWGYNRNSKLVERAVGPGYYVAYEGPGDEVLVDYTRQPKGKLAHWPEILGNEERLSRFVYAGMIDALRGVSEHVTIGRAIRNGKVADNWFVLCRQDL
ncbi:MAG TPA: hypothetical protein VFX59_01870 [Polyangiales bacterium]|nr:hypothetical protein [Polyangiales bacterium]